MSEFKVTKNLDNFYVVKLDNSLKYSVQSISFLYDFTEGNAVLLKHGSRDNVKAYHDKVKLQSKDFPDFMTDLFIIETDQLAPSEIEKMLNCSGYIPKDLRDSLST